METNNQAADQLAIEINEAVRLGMPPGERPHMRDLNRFLTKYCGVWKAVGINLGLHQSLLNMVEADNLTKQRDCLRVTLERWLDQDIYACWHQLEIAITKALKVTSTEAPTPQPSNGDISIDSINGTVKLSRYQQISTSTPMCAIVINNTSLDTSSADGRDSIGDVEKLGVLRDYGFVFHLCPDHCTADEMYSILVILALSKNIKDSLVQVTKAKNVSEALERFLVDDEVKVAMRRLTTNECIVAMHTVLRNQQMHKIVIDLLETPLSEYYGLTLFIMMRGGEGGKLIGADGNYVSTHKVVSLFSASNCPSLVDKPKIFVMQIRKGSREFANTRSINDIQISDEPDFLFLYSSTTESIDATPDEDKSLFVNSLVEVLNERLKSQHFEDVLLWVKDKIASSPYGVKEIPLVVSQMRDKLWFIYKL